MRARVGKIARMAVSCSVCALGFLPQTIPGLIVHKGVFSVCVVLLFRLKVVVQIDLKQRFMSAHKSIKTICMKTD